eukprot:Pgem_evm1s14369
MPLINGSTDNIVVEVEKSKEQLPQLPSLKSFGHQAVVIQDRVSSFVMNEEYLSFPTDHDEKWKDFK